MTTIQPSNGEDKIASHPKIINQEQKLTLLIGLVTRLDDRQKLLIQQTHAIEDRLAHIIDQNDRIIAALLPPGA